MIGRHHGGTTLLTDAIRSCQRRRQRIKLSDSTGVEMSGRRVLVSALVLRRMLHRLLGADEQHVGLLLPPSAATAVANLALALAGRVAVGLNYTLTAEMLNGCLTRAGIRHVLTSRRFLERVPIDLTAEFIYLEDLRQAPTKRDKLVAAVMARAVPASLLVRLLGRGTIARSEPLMVVFTSGSTGEPKGAVLTYGNTSASIAAVAEIMALNREDVLIGVLPFFHAFGSVLTLWTPLSLDVAAAYHPNPLDARGVGLLCRQRKGTILLATPTVLRAYQRRGNPDDFSTLDAIVAGGERLSRDLADAVEQTFGVRPTEGYGATEATSLIAATIPPHRLLAKDRETCGDGCVGRPLPGMTVEARDVESGLPVEAGRQGVLWIFGPNVMAGYLDRPDATKEVLQDGWYCTGDIAIVHGDGCVEIVGRRSRFAKIGGEMVPLNRIEEALVARLGDDRMDGPSLAVVTVADEQRGERLVVLHRPMAMSAADLRRALVASGLPPIFVPSASSFFEIDDLPLTATGKLDFGRLGQIATTVVASGKPSDRTAVRVPVAPPH